MPQNLFLADLDHVTEADLDAFLALSLPQAERPAEGLRIDFKDQVPDDLGEVVTAFANTFGGVVVLGVIETGGRPVRITGIQRTRADLKTRLANIVSSTVQPAPEFSVGIAEHSSAPGKDVAVIRVESGDLTPYMYTRDRRNRVLVRVEDNCMPADLRTLERLFEQRAHERAIVDHMPTISESRRSNTRIFARNMEDGGESNSDSYMGVWVRPARPLALLMDSRLELDVERTWHAHFIKSMDRSNRGASFFECENHPPPPRDEHRKWTFFADGESGYVAQIAGPERKNVVVLRHMVREAVIALRAARSLLSRVGWLGSVIIHIDLALGKCTVDWGQTGVFEGLDGVFEDVRSLQRPHTPWSVRCGIEQLDDPASLVAEALMHHLRQQRGLAVDLSKFCEAIRKFVA